MKYLLTAAIGVAMAVGMTAEDKTFNEARIYVNPGHGGWGPNDRNLQTITHAMGDTTGFYETNTNLHKGLELYHDLVDNGAAKVMLSRTKNGITDDTTVDGVPQIVGLSAICEDVEANNIDYFISIHSNAATEGAQTNYPLVLYRGTDAAVGNGLVDAKNMGVAAWPYINDNGITFKSHYNTPEKTNIRGDITFMGGSSTTMGYTGYYGVLRHGADGYLVEGCFHTYHPERHRLLNADYCRQEGMRYARAIRAWFNGPEETTGDIMGTVKNATQPLKHALYKYKPASMDAYAPLNEVKVVLKDAKGAVVGEYTTDKENNGIYVFEDLAPGKYTLDFAHLTDYHPYSEEIEVVANKTVFTNVKLTSINEEIPEEEEIPEVTYYTHPEQDGDIAAGSSYEFEKAGEPVTIGALEGLTVRRSILRDGKYYILAHDAERTPHLLVVNPADGSLVKEMSLEGLQTEGFNGKKMSWTLSDIAFTNDGVLIGTNSVVIGRNGNGYCNGDFYMYAWKGDGTTALEDQKPVVVLTMATNNTDNILAAGNNYSNLMANSIAINGNYNDFSFYFDSHAGGGWDTTYGLRYVCWSMKEGKMTASQWNDGPAQYDEKQFGEDAMMTLSPLAINRVIVDGANIQPKEFEVDILTTDAIEHKGLPADAVTQKSAGANYFRYADDIFMASPIYNETDHSYDVALFNITKGLDNAKLLGKYTGLLTTDGYAPMSAYGVVRNAEIDLYLMAGNRIAKVTTEGIEQATAAERVFPYDLKQSQSDEESYVLGYRLNIEPDETYVRIVNNETGVVELTVPATAKAKGEYEAVVNKADVATGTAYRWEVYASAPNVTRFAETKLAELSKPYGIAIDNNPDSEHFANLYVSNTVAGADAAGNFLQQQGILAIGNDGTYLNQGMTSCDIEWTGVQGEGPRRLAVAADGRIFAADCSTAHAGIYVINPETMKGAPLFKGGAIASDGKVTVGGTYVGGRIYAVGVRGTGDKTQLFAIDGTAPGSASWKKFTNRYDIGLSSEWTAAPSMSKASGSYVGNGNCSLVPVSGGYWAAQFRGEGSSNSGTPGLFYYSDKDGEVVFESSKIDSKATENGALAVDRAEKILVQSYGGGLRVFSYKIDKEGFPQMEEMFTVSGLEVGTALDALAFDYAGNLYGVSNAGNAWSRFVLPTNDNSISVPAKSSMLIQFGSSVDDVAAETEARLYPNPAADATTVECNKAIESVVVYNVASGAEALRVAGNGETAMTIDVSGLAQGVYLVKVNDTQAMKLIKR